ncbi:MAG TPA: GHMP kinase [Armatimonadetes bacterium]|nr:GHMP kinase [Armatimonadota bacterium]
MDEFPCCAIYSSFLRRLRFEPECTFAEGRPVFVARAPGRLDALGGVVDYSGGTVAEMPLAVAVTAALQPRADRTLRLVSLGGADEGRQAVVEVELDALLGRDYPAIAADLAREPAAAWAAYVAGAWAVLAGEGLVDGFAGGAEVVLASDVPSGAGVSSSAAVEMATLFALAAQLELDLTPTALAHLGQRVENHIVGAPCGLMDQLTSSLGRADSLLVIRCQPDQILANRHLPPGVHLGAIDTGVKHSVGGLNYGRARVAAFMAHAIILDHLRALGTVGPEDDPFGGYLSNVPAAEYERAYRPLLPAELSGESFVARWGHHGDAVTTVDPDLEYRPLAAADHHLRENANLPIFLADLEAWERTRDPAWLIDAGERMIAGHAGYRDDLGLGAEEADLLLDLAMAEGPAAGVYGGRITGGGSGGCVALLGDERLPALLPRLAAVYAANTGLTPTVIHGSSDGAAASGVLHQVF